MPAVVVSTIFLDLSRSSPGHILAFFVGVHRRSRIGISHQLIAGADA